MDTEQENAILAQNFVMTNVIKTRLFVIIANMEQAQSLIVMETQPENVQDVLLFVILVLKIQQSVMNANIVMDQY